MDTPVLVGSENVHSDAINDALTAIDLLISQEIGEGETTDDDLAPLVSARAALMVWAQTEAQEYADDDDSGTNYPAPVTASAYPDLITKSATVIRKALPAMAPLDTNDA